MKMMVFQRRFLRYLIFLGSFLAFLIGHAQECDVITNGIDLETKLHRIEIAPLHFFNYSPPEIKNDLQQSNLINCHGQLVKNGDQAALHLNLKVNSKMAPKVYGQISPDFILKIILIDDHEVKLTCTAGSKGVLNQEGTGYVYPLGYNLSQRQLRILGKKEIDKIGLQWSSGYEEYVIYEVDFLMNQIACLNRAIQKKPN